MFCFRHDSQVSGGEVVWGGKNKIGVSVDSGISWFNWVGGLKGERCGDPFCEVRALLSRSPPECVTFLIIGARGGK